MKTYSNHHKIVSGLLTCLIIGLIFPLDGIAKRNIDSIINSYEILTFDSSEDVDSTKSTNISGNAVSESVSVTLNPSTLQLEPLETFAMDINIGPVSDLMTFTTEILFDPAIVTILGVTEGDFLNENGSALTTFLKSIDNSTGKCIVAVSRMTTPASGVSSSSTNTLLTLNLKANNAGYTSLLLNNTGLIGSNGETNYGSTTNSCSVQVFIDDEHSTVSFSPEEVKVFPEESYETAVQVEDVEDLFAVSFDVNYDPDILEIVSIREGEFLNEGGETNTIFLQDIDNVNGKAVVGITRLNTTTGVSTGYPKNLFYIKFYSKEPGYEEVHISNAGLLAPDGKTTYPVFSEKLNVIVKPDQGIITGIIKNKSTGLPVEGVIVKTLDYESAPSDASGKYLLKVPYGYGYNLTVMSGQYETFDILNIHVPEFDPLKNINIELTPIPIEYIIQNIVPNPNPDISTTMQGGILHRYYQVVNNYNGNPLSLVPVEVVGENYSHVFKSDEKGIVDIEIHSNEIGNGLPGAESDYLIRTIQGVELDLPIGFNTKIISKAYTRYFDVNSFIGLGGHFLQLGIENVKLEYGGLIKLNIDESISQSPTTVDVTRQARAGAEKAGFSTPAVGVKAKIGSVEAGAIAKAGTGFSFTGILQDEHNFPYESDNDIQAVVKYILMANGAYTALDNTLIRLLILCETWLNDDVELAERIVSDAVGLEVAYGGSAEAFAGYDYGKDVRMSVGAELGAEASAELMFNFNHLKNQVENSLSFSGEFTIEAGAGVKFDLNVLPPELRGRFYEFDRNMRYGLKITDVQDYSLLNSTKEYKLTLLSKHLMNDWDEEVEYVVSGDELDQFIANYKNRIIELTQLSQSSLSGIDIKVAANTFSDLLENFFQLVNDTKNIQVTYSIQRSEYTNSEDFTIEFDAALPGLDANIGAGTEIKEGKSMIIEAGKWNWFKKYKNEEFNQPIPSTSIDYKVLMEKTINETPIVVRSLMGDFAWIFRRESSTSSVKSAMTEVLLSDNGSFINLPDEAIPTELDSISVTSWSWYGGAPDLKSANISSRVKDIVEQKRALAQEIYGMQYGIGGFYQFEPYGTILLDTAYMCIKYDPSELGDIDENTLGMYYEDKANKKWVYVGGVVDLVDHSVTAPVEQLGLFTLAPSMPYGEFGLYSTPDSIYADSVSVSSITSSLIMNNDSSIVADGTLFTVGLSHGTVLTTDVDTSTEGIQIPSVNGEINFQIRSSHLAAIGEIRVESVVGSANAFAEVIYYDTIAPNQPIIYSAVQDTSFVTLKWKQNQEEDIAGYIIYYDTDTLSPYDGVHTVYGEESPIILGNDTSRIISGLLKDTTYYFAVSAYDASGNEGPRSKFVKATEEAPTANLG
ncbi:cohesin domain-containing protein, partial [Draconibacterium sediminis]|uniref:cohesin domain-containing protein n=1 Tax=Draconibacterium sediminis TaxID=1544798 RepID=UPI0005D3F4EA